MQQNSLYLKPVAKLAYPPAGRVYKRKARQLTRTGHGNLAPPGRAPRSFPNTPHAPAPPPELSPLPDLPASPPIVTHKLRSNTVSSNQLTPLFPRERLALPPTPVAPSLSPSVPLLRASPHLAPGPGSLVPPVRMSAP